MEFTHEQITEIISEITNGEQGLQGLVKQGLESLMLSERSIHNCSHQDVSNGYRNRRVCHGGKVFEASCSAQSQQQFLSDTFMSPQRLGRRIPKTGE